MPWPLLNPSHSPIIFEISNQSDRAAAILAASFLEDRLTELLKMHLAKDAQVVQKVFGGSGPLATFSAKIDLGLLIRAYEKKTHLDLHRVRKIRNIFAHGLDPIGFDDQKIRDLCNNFDAPYFSPSEHLNSADLEKLKNKDFDIWMTEWVTAVLAGPDTPRERYLIAVRMAYLNFQVLMEMDRRKAIGSAPKPQKSNTQSSRPASSSSPARKERKQRWR